jgi:hypothetical protein
MSEAVEPLPVENFKAPDPTPTNDKPVFRGIWQGGVSYNIDTISGKVATQYTPPSLTKEIVFDDVHSILYWVDPSNPTGPAPTNPGNDPQYSYWEYAVQQWMTTYEAAHPDFKEIPLDEQIIPTATDDVHVPENFPQVTVTSPADATTFDSNQKVTVTFADTGKYPIEKSELYVNDKYISTNNGSATTFSFVPSDIGVTGGNTNTIEVLVYDTVLNQGEATTTFLTN